ncbi:hypothetical protein DKX38_023466 [Salix brachista]|uniref:Uncharacterized protein n=1 Tax=Salix brachista TaxID=2182728 RepID=A0A5N5JWR4_9ROSI|nr:hypothetical protein DKX38_023466 [Salix brachista]
MARLRGVGTRGKSIELQCNHFRVAENNADDFPYHCSISLLCVISLSSRDGRPVNQKGTGRRLHDKVRETRYLDLTDSLRNKRIELTFVFDNFSSNRYLNALNVPSASGLTCTPGNYRIPIHAITAAMRGQESASSQEALRFLDIILRQHAAKQ